MATKTSMAGGSVYGTCAANPHSVHIRQGEVGDAEAACRDAVGRGKSASVWCGQPVVRAESQHERQPAELTSVPWSLRPGFATGSARHSGRVVMLIPLNVLRQVEARVPVWHTQPTMQPRLFLGEGRGTRRRGRWRKEREKRDEREK